MSSKIISYIELLLSVNKKKCIVAFLFVLTVFVTFGVSQMPVPTPTQIPNLPNGTYNPNYVTKDDYEVYPNRGPEPYYSIMSNDNTGGLIDVYSQSFSFGRMFPHSCHYGFCQVGSVLGYTNQLPNGTTSTGYGADVGYYYTSYLGWYSNLSRVTIVATAQDDAENAGESCPIVGQPVNVTNGNMWLKQIDFALPGIGKPIEINRFYNSIIQTVGIFGRGWSTVLDESMQVYRGNLVRLNMPDGQAAYFVRETPNGLFMPHTPGIYAFIEENTSGFTLTFKDGTKHQFSVSGRLSAITDRNGNQTMLNYSDNVLTGITDASGRTLTINMSGGLVQNIRYDNQTIATYNYYQNTSNLETVTYQDGSRYKFEYDMTTVTGKTFLKTVKDANNKILETHDYDAQGRATTSEKEGGVEKYIFDYSNWNAISPYTLVKHKKNAGDPNFIETKYYFNKTKAKNFVWKTEGGCNCGSASEVTTFEYDDRLNVKKKSEQISTNLSRETTFTYNYQGDVLTKTEKVGTTILGTEKFTYNQFGQVLTYQDKINSATVPPTNTLVNVYNAKGNLETTTDALGKVTTINYPATNNKGLPDSVKDARNNVTKLRWNAAGLLEEIEDPYTKKTNYTYDARGRVKTITNALAHVTTYNYDDDTDRTVEIIYPNSDKITYKYDIRRLLESVTDERGKLTSYEFDTAYRLKKITDPLLHTREYDYDLMSNLKLTKDGLGNQTDYKYDDFNRLKEVEYPAASLGETRLKELFEYDQLGRIKKLTDTANRITNYGYDDALRTNTVTNAELETTTTKYNARWQMIQVTDAKNQVYDFSYDALGRMLTQTRAGATMTYVYNAVGNREKRTDYLGRETTYEYDNLNRLKKINYLQNVANTTPSPTPILTAVYTYDELSRLKTATNDAGTVSFNYDNRNRIKDTTDVFGHLLEYDYTLTGTVNQKSLKFDGAMYAKYNFDDADRLTSLIDSTDSTTISFGYDDADKLISKTLPNAVTTTYDYDGMSRLKRLKDVSSTATLFDRQYGYNTASQISQINEPTQVRTFGYDNVDRLTSMTNGTANESYTFDDVGNRTASHRSASYAYQSGQFNRVASTATANYSYDANGNLVSKSEGGKRWQYVWDYENRLTMAWDRKNRVRYLYDALGRRVQRYIVGGKENTKFIYDGQDVLVDDNNGTLTKYQNGLGIDNKLKVSTNGTAKYFLADHLGSTNALTDSAGNITSSASYDSFGNATGNLDTRYQFTGREFDNFTGLHYYRARWYDGNLGRFISEDPIGLAGGINTYGYVGNNPQNFRDPSGKLPIVIPILITVGVLIITSPSYVNAPAPGDPIYHSGNDLFLNAAGGAVCGFVIKRFAIPFISKLIGGMGDDIIELGISQGPRVPPPITNPGPQLGEFGIPKYYTYTSQGQSFHIAPNAMKHLEDLATHGAGNPNYLRLLGQIHQKSLQATIDDVLSRGPIKYNHMYYSGETEIMFSAPRNLLELPAVTHFRQL